MSQAKRQAKQPPTKKTAATLNPQIPKIVAEINPKNIENTIRKLVSFGTRNTPLSAKRPEPRNWRRRDWLLWRISEGGGAIRRTHDRREANFEQAKAQRVPEPTMLTNIVATLKGTQPESVNRVYVVSGHYDSMCGSPTDAKCDAPGANDDASGTAAVLEMARGHGQVQIRCNHRFQ